MSLHLFGKKDYWDKRYSRDTHPFDWYGRLQDFEKVVLEFVRPE